MYQDKTIGVVVPTFNEELLITDTINSIPEFVDKVYVVNDGSTDRTAEIIQSFNHDRILCINHSQNRGVGAAITSGYKRAQADNVDITVVMAGDNQMDPEHMLKLITPLVEGIADYTKGDRMSVVGNHKGMSNWRRFGNWLLTWLTRMATGNWRLNDPQNGYSAISYNTLKKLKLDSIYPGYGYCNDILVKLCVAGARIVDVPMPARYGHEKSKIKYSRYIPKVSWLLLKDFLWRLKVKYFYGGGVNLDFTLNRYRQLCDAICCYGYTVSTVAEYLDSHDSTQKVIVLRHDVDRKPKKALEMARLEQELGIKATYYFRFNKKVFRPPVIREIASIGHEVGYHYETLDKAKGDYTTAIQIFERELAELRKIAEVKTICMHGNPLTKWDNRDLWAKYDFRDFGLIGEAYLSFNDITYLSDTGRTWGTEHKVKDYLPSASNDSKGAKKTMVTSTDDVMELIKGGELNCVYLLVHPNRWSDNLAGWVIELVSDTVVNLVKRVLMLRKASKSMGNQW